MAIDCCCGDGDGGGGDADDDDGDDNLLFCCNAEADVMTGVCCHLVGGCCCWYAVTVHDGADVTAAVSSRIIKLCIASVRLICSAVILGVSRNDLANVECVLDSDDEAAEDNDDARDDVR